MKTFVIAEAGANHDRNFSQALRLVDAAKRAGASAVKFQTYHSSTLYRKNTPDFAGYNNINQLIKNIELPREWQRPLKDYCDKVGIEFMSTPFDEGAVEQLVNLGVKRLKISGFEATDWRFVEMVASTGLPLIISIGIGFPMNYIGKISDICDKYKNPLTLLHCNNAYPTPLSEVSLQSIKVLKEVRNVISVGFSDHTTSTLTPALAVAAGAEVIEKHFTLSRQLVGPDHAFALEPNELEDMVNLIRQAELTMIPQAGEYSPSEKPFAKARRSIVAKTPISKGEIFTVENVTTKRPCLDGDIPAHQWDILLGKRSSKDYKIDEAI